MMRSANPSLSAHDIRRILRPLTSAPATDTIAMAAAKNLLFQFTFVSS
jgi:hypothetical protein